MCGHFSPLQEDSITLKTEDLVKIQLGAHIDGFPAECGHTIVVGGKSKTKKHLNDGNEVIINKETPDQRVEDWTFEAGDVIHLDVYTTSGDGMARKAETRCTVFKR